LQDKTAGSVIRWFQRVTGFAIQLVYSDCFLHEDFRLGSLDYSNDGLVALWAVLRHLNTSSNTGLNSQEFVPRQYRHIPGSPVNRSNQDHSMAADDAKCPPTSEQKSRYKYPEAFPTPQGVNDTDWNKIYTAANGRMYYKAGNSVAIAKTYRTSGETYQLALTMLAEKQAKLRRQKESSAEDKFNGYQDTSLSIFSYLVDGRNSGKFEETAATLDSLGPNLNTHERVATTQPEKEPLPPSEAADDTPIKRWKPNTNTITQQQASAILKPASTRPNLVDPRAPNMVDTDPGLKMLANEASMDSSLVVLIKRVANGVATADEQAQLQARYEYLASVYNARHASSSVVLTRSMSRRSSDEGRTLPS